MSSKIAHSFAIRLRDLLSTLESASIISSVETRMRGLGEQLQFACMALPCDEALVAIERATLGRLHVPGVATAEGWRAVDRDFLPSGTPFAYLLGGGSGYAAELESDDDMLADLAPLLETQPRYVMFVPNRVGASVLGGVALFSTSESLGDAQLVMAERLAEVLSLTLESHRSERVLLSLFATLLPDLCAADAPTNFADKLEDWVHQLRLDPTYLQSLELAHAVGRIAAHGDRETELAHTVLSGFERYVNSLAALGDDVADGDETLRTDDLYDV